MASEEVRKELQPGVVSVHDQFPFIASSTFLCPNLCEPCVLVCERARGIGLEEIEDEVEEGRDGAGGHGFDAGLGYCGGAGVGGEGDGCAFAD